MSNTIENLQRQSASEQSHVSPEQVIGAYTDKAAQLIQAPDTDFIPTARGMLRMIMLKERRKYGTIKGDKTTSHLLPDPNDPNRSNPIVGLGTGRCAYAEMGGCAPCSFGETDNRDLSKEEIDGALDEVIAHNDKYPDSHAVFNINTNGSFLNDKELKEENRNYIYDRVRIYKEQHPQQLVVFVTEARFEDATEEKIKTMREHLGPDIPIELGFGFESNNELIREGIVGKGLDPEWKEKVALLGKYKIDTALHVMFGYPFLTEREQITDCYNSIMECLDNCGGDYGRALLMVMNKKPGTLIDALDREGQYHLPNLYAIAETVLRLGKTLPENKLKQILIFGLSSSEDHVQAGTKNIIPANEYEERIYQIFRKWRGSQDELQQLQEAFEAIPDEQYNKRALQQDLTPIDENRIRQQMTNQYLKMLAQHYCNNAHTIEQAVRQLDGVIESAKTMGGSL